VTKPRERDGRCVGAVAYDLTRRDRARRCRPGVSFRVSFSPRCSVRVPVVFLSILALTAAALPLIVGAPLCVSPRDYRV